MTETAGKNEPSAEQITLNTIRQWAERTIETTVDSAGQRTHAGGYRNAARYVMAVLAVHGKPPTTPVEVPGEETA